MLVFQVIPYIFALILKEYLPYVLAPWDELKKSLQRLLLFCVYKNLMNQQ